MTDKCWKIVTAKENFGNKAPSLQKRCIDILLPTLEKNLYEWNFLVELPPHLKDRFLHILGRRELINDDNIGFLVNDKTQCLHLSRCKLGEHGLKQVAFCKSLLKLDLNDCGVSGNITTQGLCVIFSSCKLLQIVSMRRNKHIGDEALVTLAKNCPYLRELNVGHCRQLTDESLKALGEHSNRLESIDFSYTQVTDVGVQYLVRGVCLNTLKEILMNGCLNITDEAIQAVALYCPLLSILVFYGCPLVTEEGRNILEHQKVCSQLKQLSWTVY